MAIRVQTQSSLVSIPVTLPQIAEGLRRLSKSELETLELLLHKEAMRTIKQSVAQEKRGKVREL